MSMDDFMKQAKVRNQNLDNELDDMIKNDPELKKLQKKASDDCKYFPNDILKIYINVI